MTVGAMHDRNGLLAPKAVDVTYRADGVILLRSPIPLSGVATHLCDYLEHWAVEAPDRVFLAQRDNGGNWRTVTFKQARQSVLAIGEALIAAGLNQTRPIAILTGNSIEHGLLTFAGMAARVPVAPISPAYSTHPEGLKRLTSILNILKPAAVFAQSAKELSQVTSLPALSEVTWLTAREITTMAQGSHGELVAAAREAATPDDVAKILFTSGSTGMPKGVPQTQAMLTSAASASALVTSVAVTPVIVDWMPWHHTMGGNNTLHFVLRDGGTLYIDDGRPVPGMFERTIANLREIPVTSAVNVPAGLQMLVEAMDRDPKLRQTFFSRIGRVVSAGAVLPDDVRNGFQALARRAAGQEITLMSGYGTTETGPGITTTHWPASGGREIGLPFPGVEVKLVPTGDRFEIRARGPNVMKGYFGRPDLNETIFDEEGFYKVGDAVTFIDPADPRQGLRFAGRLGENFKLANGSWVLTGELRSAILAACPSLREVVIAGHDRDDLRILAWLVGNDDDGKANRTECNVRVADELRAFNASNSNPTRRVAAFALLTRNPSLGAGEITDKGYVNQRAVLQSESALVEALYGIGHDDRVAMLS